MNNIRNIFYFVWAKVLYLQVFQLTMPLKALLMQNADKVRNFNPINKNVSVLFLFGIIFSTSFWSCKTTNKLEDKQYLLVENNIRFKQNKNSLTNIKNSDKLTEELTPLFQQKPNRKILGLVRLHLAIYNLGNKGKETKLKSWIKKTIGEEPVIVDSSLIQKTARQMQLYLINKGYFNAFVQDSLAVQGKVKRKAKVVYMIEMNKPYTINNKYFTINDPVIKNIVQPDDVNSLIKKGDDYNADIFQRERDRITIELRNRGYYYFSKEYIYFQIDSSLNSHQVDIVLGIKKVNENLAGIAPQNHRAYSINKIYVQTDYDPKLINDTLPKDTVEHKGIFFIYSKDNKYINPEILLRTIFIKQGDLFQASNLDYTYKRLSDLGIFKFVNIRCEKKTTSETDSLVPRPLSLVSVLDCYIQLTPLSKQSFSFEVEGTNNSGDLGIAGNIVYRNKNIFKRAELFEFKINGGLEAQKTLSDNKTNEKLYLFNTMRVSPEMNISFPKDLVRGMSKHADSRINIFTGYNYQERPAYTRSIVNLALSYHWKETATKKWSISPIDINYVDIFKIDSVFQEQLDSYTKTIRSSYEPHFVPAGKVSWTFNNQDFKKNKSFTFFKTNIELAGNLFYGINLLTNYLNNDPSKTTYLIFEKQYSQYTKVDLDFRYYHIINAHNTLAYRAIAGAGKAYGNSTALPFEKSFSAGGANDIRAWGMRTLGPGSYKKTDLDIEQTGDMKLEGNVEYRFDVFKMVQGALFTDAGNVWTFEKDNNHTGGEITNNFLNDIAIGGGIGIRLNFSFLIIRLDGATIFKDPSRANGERWLKPVEYNLPDVKWNFGIGYPF